MNYIKELYEQKKASAEKRFIKWELSLEEFTHLYALRNTETCAYSGLPFNLTDATSDEYPSIERIDDLGTYSLSNVLLVSRRANLLKDRYIDKGVSQKGLPEKDLRLIHRIEKLMGNKDALAEKQIPYLDIKTSLQKENLEKSKLFKEKMLRLQEVEVAEMYSKFGRTIVDHCGKEMPLSFSQFKRSILRKTCELTNEVLPEKLSERSLWVRDKNLPVDRSNIVTTTKNIQESLDMFEVNSKMNHSQIVKIFKGVVK